MAAGGRAATAPRPTPAAAARGHCPPPERRGRGRDRQTAGGSGPGAQKPARHRLPRPLKGAALAAAVSAGERRLARREDAVSSVPGGGEAAGGTGCGVQDKG